MREMKNWLQFNSMAWWISENTIHCNRMMEVRASRPGMYEFRKGGAGYLIKQEKNNNKNYYFGQLVT